MIDNIQQQAIIRAHKYLNKKAKAKNDLWLSIAFGLCVAVLLFMLIKP